MFDETENETEKPTEDLTSADEQSAAEETPTEDTPETEADAKKSDSVDAEGLLCEPAAEVREEPTSPSEAPAVVAAENPRGKSNVGGVIMLILLFLAIVGFAVFCIVWDVQKGTPSGGYQAGDVVHVTLTQNKKPVRSEEMTDENGRYTVAGIAETVMPSIVEIYTYAGGVKKSSGSGIILTADGYIVTNAHVVADADVYEVTVGENKKYNGKLIGHDSKTDIAILKIDATGLQPASLGDSDETQLGEEVCALGNPAGFTASISSGVISGLKRSIQVEETTYAMECFQTDAAISPGNSGGALVNRYGDVIGITSSKYGSSFLMGNDFEGLGFAITINAALPIITELMENGYISGRVRIGIQFYDADVVADMDEIEVPAELQGKGVLVCGVDEDSDLAKTTFKIGDWMLTMNGHEISDYDTVKAAIAGLKGGDRIHVRCATVDDDGKVTYYEIDFSLLEDKSGNY